MCSKMLKLLLCSVCASLIASFEAAELDHDDGSGSKKRFRFSEYDVITENSTTAAVLFCHPADFQCGLETGSNPLHYSPWLVLLEYVRSGRMGGLRCGGTLLGRQHVVTAAHCIRKVKHHRILIRLGDYNLDTSVDCVSGECADTPLRVAAARVHVHPGYDGLEHDIAIIKLKKKVPCTHFIRPICLPKVKLKNFAIFEAAGWGTDVTTGLYSNVKKSVSLPSWTYTACRKVYRQHLIPQNVICAGGMKGIDTCRGDSGGPLTYRGKFTELHGVISFGPAKCGSEGAPGIHQCHGPHRLDPRDTGNGLKMAFQVKTLELIALIEMVKQSMLS